MNPKQQLDYVQRNAWGTSQLGLLAGLGTLDTGPGASGTLAESSLTTATPDTSGGSSNTDLAARTVQTNPIAYGLTWTAPAVVGGAISGLVAASTTRGAMQGAMWAGGGAAATAGAIMLFFGKKTEGWSFLLGGLGLSGYAAWRAISKA